MKEDVKMVEKRRIERINDMITCKSYKKYGNLPENKGIFINGFKHVETHRIDNYVLIGCKLDVLYENIKLFNFWSNKFTNNEIEKRDFQITGGSFMTLVKSNEFFHFSGHIFVIEDINLNRKCIYKKNQRLLLDPFQRLVIHFNIEKIFYFNKNTL